MKKYIIGSIFIFLALTWMAVIYYFSNQNAVSSTIVVKNVTRYTVKLFVPHYSELSIEEQRTIFWRFYYFIRKMAHFTEFAVLSFFLFICLNFLFKRDWITHLVTFILIFLLASGDEIHQYFVEGRISTWKDVCIDVAGAFVMLGCIAIYRNIYKKNRIGKRND